ncbi:MAG: hypothetical protein ACJAUP_000553 [Cellvibrionaceae bacterium]|jgi:hypothetical protein
MFVLMSALVASLTFAAYIEENWNALDFEGHIMKVFWFLGVLALAGCGPNAVSEKVSLKISSVSRPLGVGHSHKSNYQKPGANIQLLTAQIDIGAAGEVVSSRVSLRVGHSQGSLSVSFGRAEGLDLLHVGKLGSIDLERVHLSNSSVIDIPLSFYASIDGRHYLPLSAVVVLPNGQRLQRAMSVVVIVGQPASSKPARKTDATVHRTPRGRLIKMLPATEDIR